MGPAHAHRGNIGLPTNTNSKAIRHPRLCHMSVTVPTRRVCVAGESPGRLLQGIKRVGGETHTAEEPEEESCLGQQAAKRKRTELQKGEEKCPCCGRKKEKELEELSKECRVCDEFVCDECAIPVGLFSYECEKCVDSEIA